MTLYKVEVLAHLNIELSIDSTDEEQALTDAEVRVRATLGDLFGANVGLPLVEAIGAVERDAGEPLGFLNPAQESWLRGLLGLPSRAEGE